MYYDSFAHISGVIARWIWRTAIRSSIRSILRDLEESRSEERFFTVLILDEERSYSQCYFLGYWRHLFGDDERRGELYLTRSGGFLAQLYRLDEGPHDLLRIYPGEIHQLAGLRPLLKTLKHARQDAESRRRDYEWRKGDYVTW